MGEVVGLYKEVRIHHSVDFELILVDSDQRLAQRDQVVGVLVIDVVFFELQVEVVDGVAGIG